MEARLNKTNKGLGEKCRSAGPTDAAIQYLKKLGGESKADTKKNQDTVSIGIVIVLRMVSYVMGSISGTHLQFL